MSDRWIALVARDYLKIFLHDGSPKREMYDADYSDRMRQFAARPAWREEIEAVLSDVNLPSDARILDVGCNSGYGAELASEILSTPIDGVDRSEAAIKMARRAHESSQNHYQLADGQDLPFDDETFDLVYSMHVIGHVDAPQRFLDECCRVLKPGGVLRIVTPNAVYKALAIIDTLKTKYRPDPTVVRYFFKPELRRLAQSCSFVDVRVSTLGEKPILAKATPFQNFAQMRLILRATKPVGVHQ